MVLGGRSVRTGMYHGGDGGALRPADAPGPDGAGALPGLHAGAAAYPGAVEAGVRKSTFPVFTKTPG